MNKTAILILAAGGAFRMGRTKQLLPLGNTTLLGRVLENARNSNADQVLCVLGAEAEKISSELRLESSDYVINSNWKEGLSSSIETGISFFINSEKPPEKILIVLGDQPSLSSEVFNTIIHCGSLKTNFIVASNYGDKVGVPALIPARYFKKLLELKGDKGASDFLNSERVDVQTIHLENSMEDIDTPEDYDSYIKTLV